VPVEQIRECLARDSETLGRRGYGQPKRLQERLPNNLTGVNQVSLNFANFLTQWFEYQQNMIDM